MPATGAPYKPVIAFPPWQCRRMGGKADDVMTEALLKAQLEPVARRQRRWKRARGLVISWSILVALGFLLLLLQPNLGDLSPLTLPLLVGTVFITTILVWRRHSKWEPDYQAIARQIEQKHPELHALLLTAVEQKPDPATGKLNFLQERVVSEALSQSR